MTIIKHPDDQGHTVYSRNIRSSERTVVHTGPVGSWRIRWYEWEEILREAENNPALDDLIKKAEMVYALTK